MIERDGMDILIDMAEHMSGLCACIVARKPAPVQLTWCYPYSSGQYAMDYRVSDEHADPAGMTERFNSEKLIRLPRSYFCYRPLADTPEVGPLPAERNGYVTFGSFNQLPKLSRRVVGVWGKILGAMRGSRIAVFAPGGKRENQHLLEWFRGAGVEEERVDLLPRARRREFLDYF